MVKTNREKFNEKYKKNKNTSHSLNDIHKLTGIPTRILQEVFNRGVGARKTNPESVRRLKDGKKVGGKSLTGKMSGEQWGQARVFSFVMKQPGTWGKADKDLADKVRKLKLKGFIR